MSGKGVNFDPFAQFDIPRSSAGAASSSASHAVESEELKYRQLARTIQTICAKIATTELRSSAAELVNLSCGHTVNAASGVVELGCALCRKDVKKHSRALDFREIVEIISSVNDTTPFEELKQKMGKIQTLVQDGATLEYLTDAVTLPCGHTFQASTVARLTPNPLCPTCRHTITSENIVPARILQKIAFEFAKATKEEDAKEEEKISLLVQEQRRKKEEHFNSCLHTIDETLATCTRYNDERRMRYLAIIKQNILHIRSMLDDIEERNIVHPDRIVAFRSTFHDMLDRITASLADIHLYTFEEDLTIIRNLQQFENTLHIAEEVELAGQEQRAAELGEEEEDAIRVVILQVNHAWGIAPPGFHIIPLPPDAAAAQATNELALRMLLNHMLNNPRRQQFFP